jgi:hypothetical protein
VLLDQRVIVAQQEPLELKEALAHQEGKERGVWQVLLDRRVIVVQQVHQDPLELKEALAHRE